jgi:hypothetical protein
MREFEVNCIARSDPAGGHEHITHIGHTQHDWCLTREAAVKRIEAGFEAFYTIDLSTGERAVIEVLREHGQRPYLRTRLHGTWTDHLLSLAPCGQTEQLIA